jgi:hypothetical protein
MDDETVRRRVVDELERAPMIASARLGIAVENGTVARVTPACPSSGSTRIRRRPSSPT